MPDRRDFIIGGSSLAAATLSLALKPRRRMSLMNGVTLNQVVPDAIGDWQSKDVSDLVDAKGEDNLMTKLYGQTLERLYTNSRTQSQIMMLFAHGDTQSNDLQLHRPEVCYPAFGMEILKSDLYSVALGSGVLLPARSILASGMSRQESIIYWTRLGNFLPTSGGAQRLNRLETSMSGYIADGLLARLSMANIDHSMANRTIATFIRDLVSSCQAKYRPALLGAALAGKISA